MQCRIVRIRNDRQKAGGSDKGEEIEKLFILNLVSLSVCVSGCYQPSQRVQPSVTGDSGGSDVQFWENGKREGCRAMTNSSSNGSRQVEEWI